MNDSNDQTIQAYQTHVQEYIDGTPQEVPGFVKALLDQALAELPTDARILEIGSATGRDASYVRQAGYSVTCTDATPAFVELLNKKGLQARQLNALTDDLGGPYNLILANAVLLHFTQDEMRKVLGKIWQSLAPHGRFACTVKQGDGEKWLDDKLGSPRYFCFWQPNELRATVANANFRITSIHTHQAPRTGTHWIDLIAEKQ